MSQNDNFFSQELAKEKENLFGPSKREEEKRLMELQKQQRKESLELLGYDVLEAHCPKCGENYCMTIKEPGKKLPRLFGLSALLFPRLRRTETVLHCFSCDSDITTPSFYRELVAPLAILLILVLLGVVDIWLINFVCTYSK